MSINVFIDVARLKEALNIELTCANHFYDYLVINDGGVYRVISGRSGAELASFDLPESAIQYAIDNAIQDVLAGLITRIFFIGSFTINNPVTINISVDRPIPLILHGGTFDLYSTFLNIVCNRCTVVVENMFVSVLRDNIAFIYGDGLRNPVVRDVTIYMNNKASTGIHFHNELTGFIENVYINGISDGAVGVKLTTDETTGCGETYINRLVTLRSGYGNAVRIEGVNGGFRQHDTIYIHGWDTLDLYNSSIDAPLTDDQFAIVLKDAHKELIYSHAEHYALLVNHGDDNTLVNGQPVRVRNYNKLTILGVKVHHLEAFGGLTRVLTDSQKTTLNGGDVLILGDPGTIERISGNIYKIMVEQI
jgi:hypothetical protein